MTDERELNEELSDKLLRGFFFESNRAIGKTVLLPQALPLAVHLAMRDESAETFLGYYCRSVDVVLSDYLFGMSGCGEFPYSARLHEELVELKKKTGLVDTALIFSTMDGQFHFQEDAFPGKGKHLRDSTGRFLDARL